MSNKLSQILQVFAPHHIYHSDLEDARINKPHSLKLNFRNIKEIDDLVGFQLETYEGIQELSLNHNKLKSLKGLSQFKNLQKLSLNNNCIDHLEIQLGEYISRPKLLRELSCLNNVQDQSVLNGNLFKSVLKGIFPNLVMLNGQKIDDIEPRQSKNVRKNRVKVDK